MQCVISSTTLLDRPTSKAIEFKASTRYDPLAILAFEHTTLGLSLLSSVLLDVPTGVLNLLAH